MCSVTSDLCPFIPDYTSEMVQAQNKGWKLEVVKRGDQKRAGVGGGDGRVQRVITIDLSQGQIKKEWPGGSLVAHIDRSSILNICHLI